MLCNCIGCDNPATDKVLGWLTEEEKLMLGYFCGACIKGGCSNEHRISA